MSSSERNSRKQQTSSSFPDFPQMFDNSGSTEPIWVKSLLLTFYRPLEFSIILFLISRPNLRPNESKGLFYQHLWFYWTDLSRTSFVKSVLNTRSFLSIWLIFFTSSATICWNAFLLVNSIYGRNIQARNSTFSWTQKKGGSWQVVRFCW